MCRAISFQPFLVDVDSSPIRGNHLTVFQQTGKHSCVQTDPLLLLCRYSRDPDPEISFSWPKLAIIINARAMVLVVISLIHFL